MNGRTLLQARFVAAIAFSAAAFVSTQASARPQGEAPATPAPTTAPASDAPKTDAPKTDEPKDDTKKTDADDPTKKKAAGAKAEEPGAAGPAGGAVQAPGAGADGSASISLGGEQPRKDEVKVESKKTDDEEENRDPFAGSIIFWDHSVSTQTARMETSAQQSYIPLYEWWFSFQPRYHFNKKLQATARFDYTKELTNSQDTTYYREGVFGDAWLSLRYDTPISERLKNTKVGVIGTLKLPFSKESQAQGVYVKTSAGGSISQKIPINGESAKWFPSAGVRASASYEHAWTKSTTPTGGGFSTYRQDTEGRTFVTDQLTGGMLAQHSMLGILAGDLSLTEKWSANLSLILINRWNYAPKDDVTVQTDTGSVYVPRSGDASRFSQTSWIIFGTDYEVIDEMTVGVGYYNLAGVIAPDGQRRGFVGDHNIWWSPSARVFATVTANLDKIYERAAGIKKPEEKKKAAQQGPSPSTQAAPVKF